MFFQSEKMCWCGSGLPFEKCHGHPSKLVTKGTLTPQRHVPKNIVLPDYALRGTPRKNLGANHVETPETLAKIRAACLLARKVLLAVLAEVKVGVTTDSLDAFAHAMIIANGAYPSPLNYYHYPKSICTSVNEVVCHGIPDSRPLADGDILNIDVTVYLDGFHGDCNQTVAVGAVDDVKRDLMYHTWNALRVGIEAVTPGVPVSAIGRAIDNYINPLGYGVVRMFCGHGIGSVFHTGLQVSHSFDPKLKTILKPGMVFTIEPMINLGSYDCSIWRDNWTAVTKDLFPSAQYEHTLVVTDSGYEILTLLPNEKFEFPG